MPHIDSMANGGVGSPDAEEQKAVPKSSPAAAPTKGRGLRRWRRIQREQPREGNTPAAAAGIGGRGDEDSAQLHKRRIPLPAGAPKAKHESPPVADDESYTASVESRFVSQAPANLDPGLGLRVAFAIGADSDHGDDRSSRSSTAAIAPRVLARHGHDKHTRAARSRADRLKVHAAVGSVEAKNSRSSVESDLRSYNAVKEPHLGVGVTGNGVHESLSASGDHSGVGRRREDVRSTAAGGYCKENGGSVVGRMAGASADTRDGGLNDTLDEGSGRNGQNGELHSGADPYAESFLLLKRTQEALENEIDKVVAAGKVPSDEFDIYAEEWSDSVHSGEPVEEVSERIKLLKSSLKEASALIKEKDSRILELGTLSRSQPGKIAIESTNLLLWQSELDGLYQEKIQTEIQFIILTAACQILATLADDQMALYEAQKSLSVDYQQLGLKLRQAENRAMVLEEKAEKLQMQCKELSRGSEVLQLQSEASRTSLFCFVQFILLCIGIGTCLMRLVPSPSSEAVPT